MTPDNDEYRLDYLADVARLYYEQGKNQQEIANVIGVSRPTVSRLLSEALDKGVVEIIIHDPWHTLPDLEAALCRKFPSLKSVMVLESGGKSYEKMVEGLGALAAGYFNSILHDGMIIGISWGSALYQMIKKIPEHKLSNAEVVQLVGATGSEKIPTNGPTLAQFLSTRLGGICRYLYAPGIVGTEVARDAILKNRDIRETLDRAERCDVALVGIGSTKLELNSSLRAGYLTEGELTQIRSEGAVGDVCVKFFSIDGEYLDIEINRRTIGIGLETIRNIPTVIGVGGGLQKVDAIMGALCGRYINVLITDDQLAKRITES